MKDSFIIEGKKYISSRRASEISDYSSDYIGQLCRAEKLDCKMVGRAWFITEESLHLHKASILHDEISRNRIENLRGKKSRNLAAAAAKVAAANSVAAASAVQTSSSSVNDSTVSAPITASQTSVDSNGSSIVSPVSVEVKKDQVVHLAVKSLEGDAIADKFIAKNSAEIKSNVASPVISVSSFTYMSDDRPLLPTLKKPEPVVASTSKNRKILSFFSMKDIVGTKTDKKSSTTPVASVAQVFADKAKSTKGVKIETVATKSEVPVNGVVDAHKPLEVLTAKGKSLVSYPELTRSIILKRALASALVVAFFFGIGSMTFNLLNGNGNSVATNTPASKSVGANIYDAVVIAGSFIKNGYSNTLAFFTRPSRLTFNDSPPNDSGGGSGKVEPDTSPNGIAVVSSSGSDSVDEAVKQKIKDSFSDEVVVSPDKSGTAGVITPVFRETKGKDFVYVMVPVNGKGMSTTP